MKKIFLMLFALTTALQAYSTDVLKGEVLLNGEEIKAEFVKLSDTTVALGTGYDACIRTAPRCCGDTLRLTQSQSIELGSQISLVVVHLVADEQDGLLRATKNAGHN